MPSVMNFAGAAAADIRMLNDRNLRRFLILHGHRDDVLPLKALFRVVQRMQVGRHREADAHHPDALAFFIHHLEHDFHPFALLAHEIADALAVFAEVQRTGGVAVNPHLAFDAAAIDVIGLSQFPLFVDPDFWDDKNGNALRARGVAFDSGQNGVNDVFGQIMVAGGNEAFRAGDGIRSIRVFLGGGFQSTDIGAGTGFRQAHGSAPYTRVHFFQDDVAQGVLEEVFHQAGRAVRETRVHQKRLIAG
jgi:hypothetical protein